MRNERDVGEGREGRGHLGLSVFVSIGVEQWNDEDVEDGEERKSSIVDLLDELQCVTHWCRV